MPHYEPIIGIEDYKILSVRQHGIIEISVEYLERPRCPKCSGENLRKKDSFLRRIKHYSVGNQKSILTLRAHKFFCKICKTYFNQRFKGILPRFQSTEPFREEVAQKHHWGLSKARSAQVLGVSSSTVERCYRGYLAKKNSHRKNASCPKILGIDEKHFTRKKGYMTTFCDLKRHKVFDVKLGRSKDSLKSYLGKLPDKGNCRVIVMDLSETYRSIAREYFGRAMIVADRFHVVKLINHHFLKTW